jgi:hypothetical protein
MVGILACALSVALSASALGATRYAEVGGNGPAGECPQGDPCAIEDAINDSSVAPGDVINLLPGTYATTANLSPDSRVTIQGAPGMARPTISADFTAAGGALYAIVINDSGSIVRDLNVNMNEDDSLEGYFSLGLRVGSANATIERVRLAAIGTYGSGASLGSESGGTTIIRDSILTSAGSYPALRTEGPPAPELARIKILNVTAEATGSGIIPDALHSPDAYGNQSITARNSIFESVNGEAVRGDSSFTGDATVSIAIDHSNMNKAPLAVGSDATITEGGGNQSTAPSFVDRANGNFTQVPGSVTIDAGVTDPALGSTDFGGQPRLLDLAPDIGADELDVLVPTTALNKQPRRRIRKRRARFEFSSNEPGASFECKRNRKPFRPCSSPKLLRGLKVGRHVFKVRAVDAVGKRDATPAIRRFRVLPRR